MWKKSQLFFFYLSKTAIIAEVFFLVVEVLIITFLDQMYSICCVHSSIIIISLTSTYTVGRLFFYVMVLNIKCHMWLRGGYTTVGQKDNAAVTTSTFYHRAVYHLFNSKRLGPLNFLCSFMMCCLINHETGGDFFFFCTQAFGTVALGAAQPEAKVLKCNYWWNTVLYQ